MSSFAVPGNGVVSNVLCLLLVVPGFSSQAPTSCLQCLSLSPLLSWGRNHPMYELKLMATLELRVPLLLQPSSTSDGRFFEPVSCLCFLSSAFASYFVESYQSTKLWKKTQANPLCDEWASTDVRWSYSSSKTTNGDLKKSLLNRGLW